MKFRYLTALVLALVSSTFALEGQIGIHDPSTIIQCYGKYYTFGTGGGGSVSNDGWNRTTDLGVMKVLLAPAIVFLFTLIP